jgi:hypothetical protein
MAKRSPEQGVDAACSDHTKELVWRHLNVVERKCELRCRLPRRRWQTPDPSHPLKTAKSHYVHCDRERTGAAEILFARFREEDVQAGKLISKDAGGRSSTPDLP